MAETLGGGSAHLKLNLTAEEKRLYSQLFRAADPDSFGAVSGDVAVTFFEKTKLPADVLGQIWQIADTENRGLLTPPGFSVVLRLIGHAQAGRTPAEELASQPGPLPRFDGLSPGAPEIAAQNTGQPASPTQSVPPPIRVPALSAEKVNEYVALFDKSGAENGLLPGIVAKQIFERARLPNEVLGRIWNLADIQSRGGLDATEFAIAMHLLASYKSGTMRGVPQTLPQGLYDAAARRSPVRTSTGSFPGAGIPPVPGIPPQFTGMSGGRAQSPIARQQISSTPLSTQSTGDGWAISPAEKARFDQIFSGLDKANRGFVAGEQAVEFFGNARLPEETLAQIWDLADINSAGQLNRDEFAVAMYLIKQQRGTREGRGNLPATLPPSLVPPMMRKQQAPPSHPTAPAFENAPVTKPKSAADDLFGLDAFTSASTSVSPQVPQLTGGSAAGGPFQNPKSPPPPPTASPSPPTVFKPFVPSSSFGQTLAPQPTGLSTASQAHAPQGSASDDLLGDGDPEISQRLNAETSELANLSNQIGNLTKQTQEVRATRVSTEQELSQGSQQKKEFELRLSQIRAMYEKEVKDLKVLQEQRTVQENDLKRLQQDIAILEGGLQDAQNQKQQVAAVLEAETREKAVLTDRIKAANAELNDLRPQVEKTISEARQQKGLVAINRKQLATLEAERERLQDELNDAKTDLDAAKKEAEEQARSAQASAITSPASVASPAASALSTTNPFFRRGTGMSETAFSPPMPSRQQTKDRENAFDSVFGPSIIDPPTATSPPSSNEETPFHPRQGVENAATPTGSPAQFSSYEPVPASEPPAPPKSRQITSAALPFRAPIDRADSISSSVKVVPPASRLSPANTPRAATPSASTPSAESMAGGSPPPNFKTVAGADNEELSFSPHPLHPTPRISLGAARNSSEVASVRSASQDIPGAFPQTETPRSEFAPAPAATGGGGGSGLAAAAAAAAGVAVTVSAHEAEKGKEEEEKTDRDDSNFDHYFGGPAHSRSPSERAADFDTAFASLKQPTANGPATTSGSEFPPIRELEDDASDDSSEAPTGFEDNFTVSSPPRPSKDKEAEHTQPNVHNLMSGSLQARPLLTTAPSTNSTLPDIGAQQSPPAYGDSVPHDNPDHFPLEYKGLLPSRGDPTPSSKPPHSVDDATGAPATRSLSQPYAPEAAKSPPALQVGASSSGAAAPQRQFTEDDFEAAFAGMTPAPVVDDDDDDEEDEDVLDTTFTNNHATEFDPTFDSPNPSKSTRTTAPPTMASSAHFLATSNPAPNNNKETKATDDLYNSSAHLPTSQPSLPASQSTNNTTVFKDTTDWDDLFSAFDKPPPSTSPTNPADQVFSPPPGPPPQHASSSLVGGAATTAKDSTAAPTPPQLTPTTKQDRPSTGRALSTGTEHDDPILKRLTAMGWSRDESLKALEQFDYNIDKAADYLTFKS